MDNWKQILASKLESLDEAKKQILVPLSGRAGIHAGYGFQRVMNTAAQVPILKQGIEVVGDFCAGWSIGAARANWVKGAREQQELKMAIQRVTTLAQKAGIDLPQNVVLSTA